jgi:MFS family permease
VRRQLDVTDAQWGFANVGATAGSLISLTIVVAVIARVGPRRLALIGAPLLLLNTPVLAGSTNQIALVAGLLVQGMATGLLASPMNAQAVDVERRYGRRIMSSFHACFSLGQLAGGLIGTFAAQAGIRANTQLACSSFVLALLLLATFRWLPRTTEVARVTRLPLRLRFTPQLRLLAGLALLASVNEGSAAQWSAQFTANTLGAGVAAGAATYTCFTVAMTLSRTAGDRLVNRMGQRLFVRLSEVLVAVGFGTTLIVGTPMAAFIGFALLGLGSGCIVPSVLGLAGNQPGIPTGQGVSIVSLGQWPAMLIGPPLIGVVAGLVGLRDALFVLVVCAGLIVVLAGWITEPGSSTTRVVSSGGSGR